MPWPAVSWHDEEARQEMASTLGVHGIPTLVVLAPDDSVITAEGRPLINDDPEAEVKTAYLIVYFFIYKCNKLIKIFFVY